MNKNLKLLLKWKERLKLRTEGNKLWTESNKLRAESNKLWTESNKLRTEGNKLWAETILKVYGNISLDWKNWNENYKAYECHLENGEVYGFDNVKKGDSDE